MNRIFNFYREHLLIVLFTVGVALIMLLLQMVFSDVNAEFGLSLIPNFIADMIGILISSYIIAVLLQRSEEKKTKEKVYKMLGRKHLTMVDIMAQKYVHFITKNPCSVKGDESIAHQDLIEQVRNVRENISQYVQDDFLRKNVKVLAIGQAGNYKSIFDMFEEQMWSHQQFCHHFKHEMKNLLNLFISKYISVLPDDLREILFSIEDLMESGAFVTPLDHGINMQMNNVDFKKEDFINILVELGTEILSLMEYFKEFEQKT
ncbi:hypothetical protein P8864_22045 [Priestia flexa]|nr:hypothetical protein [Priestia flexa]MEC0668520.1 hypothetical protein [Priestia flexa]